jgi:hypothetical protein
VWAAAAIATVGEIDTVEVVGKGATIAACYLVSAAPVNTRVKILDRAVYAGKK